MFLFSRHKTESIKFLFLYENALRQWNVRITALPGGIIIKSLLSPPPPLVRIV